MLHKQMDRPASHPKGILLPLLFMVLCSASLAQTATNTCGTTVGGEFPVHDNMCLFTSFNLVSSFSASMNPGGCSSGNNLDGWGWFTANQTSTVVTYDPEGSHRPILHVFTGTCGNLVQVACHNSGANGLNAQVVLATVPGQIYFIRIQRHNTNSAMSGRICIYTPPANDNCTVPIELAVAEECYMQPFTNEGATYSVQGPNPTCGGTINSTTMLDIWFEFYAPESGVVLIETSAGTLTDAVMQLYSGPCHALVLVECDDDDGPGTMPRIDRSCNPLSPYQRYTLRVFGKAGAFGTFDICIKEMPPNSHPQEDCAGGKRICNSQTITNNAVSFGCTQDLNSGNRGCLLSNERQGTWYFFSPSNAGIFELTIKPVDANGDPAQVDYDFAIWGPMVNITCPPSTVPARCSYASPVNSGSSTGAGTYLTGLASGNTDHSEPAFNSSTNTQVNGFVAPLTVTADDVGKHFIMFVDNFAQNGQSFRIDWILGGGASLNCMVLPVELTDLQAAPGLDHVLVNWATMSEYASERFVVERSVNGIDFSAIGDVQAAGYSQIRIDYQWYDMDPMAGVAYYRIRKLDTDGSDSFSGIVAATFRSHNASLVLYPNPAQESITLEITEAGQQVVQLFDGSGRMVRSLQTRNVEPGPLVIPLNDLEPGSYTIRTIAADGHFRIGRFIRN